MHLILAGAGIREQGASRTAPLVLASLPDRSHPVRGLQGVGTLAAGGYRRALARPPALRHVRPDGPYAADAGVLLTRQPYA
jgi:hypothetical protein